MTDSSTSTFRLILWPSIVTLAVSAVRLIGEQQGWFSTNSGGSGTWLGAFWFGLVFAVWFAFRLRRAGSAPRGARPWAWSMLSLLAIVAAFAFTLPAVIAANADEAGYAALRTSALAGIAGASIAAAVQFVVWPRLAWTLLVYAIPARLTVVALTWFAKHNEWDSHYTKFGPKGWEFDMEGTMSRAALMQMGFWVPITVVFGALLGVLLCGRKKKA